MYAGKNAIIYDSVQEEGNIYTVLKNSDKKYVDNFEVIKGELIYSSQDEQQLKWAQEIGIKVSPYIIIDGELMSSDKNLYLMDKETGTVIIPENVTKIGEGAFSNLDGLQTIVIPGTVKEIGTNAFRNNKTLEKVIIQEGVEIIGAGAFRECTRLQTIELPESITQIKSTAFYICTSLQEIEIPSKITKIAEMTFALSNKLSKCTFRGDKVTEICAEAFHSTCFSEFNITKNVQSISSSAFTKNSKLDNITIDNTNFVYENGILTPRDKRTIIFVSSKYYQGKTEFTIPEGVVNFETSMIDLNTVKKLIITSKVSNINPRNLSPNLEEIEVVNENTVYEVSEKCLYTTSNPKRLIYCYSKENEITLNIDVDIISQFSFAAATNATKITLNDTAKTIENQVFTSKLRELIIKDQVNDISGMFLYLRYNTKVTIDSKNPNYIIENDILYTKDKSKLVTVISQIKGKFILDDNVKEIGNSAFYSQGEMTEIDLKSIEKIGSNVFYSCNKLTQIDIPSTTVTIDNYAFNSASNLKEVVIHKAENTIAGSPWCNPHGLRAIKWQP